MPDNAGPTQDFPIPHRCGVGYRKENIWTKLKRLLGVDPSRGKFNDDPSCKWFHPVTWKLGPLTSELEPEFIQQAIADALLSWSEVCNFKPDALPSTGRTDLTFGFYTSSERQILRGNWAYAYFPCDKKKGQVYFNKGQTWTPRLFELYALHEVGHIIGLQDDTNDFEDVMQTTPDQASLQFSDTDITRASNLYKRGRDDDATV